MFGVLASSALLLSGRRSKRCGHRLVVVNIEQGCGLEILIVVAY